MILNVDISKIKTLTVKLPAVIKTCKQLSKLTNKLASSKFTTTSTLHREVFKVQQ